VSLEKKIYLVGGAVRDKLLGIDVQDKDYVAVGYSEQEFSHLEKVGKDFPVFLSTDGSELALARRERKVSIGYNGFIADTNNISLEDDLMRRDLTINSIAYDEKTDRYIDPFHGQKDLKKKILRHTSEAFVEDPLRVLRLARFRAYLGADWKISPSTKVLVYQMKNELDSLQADRVWKEIEKVLKLRTSHLFFETLFELGVLQIIFPFIYDLTTIKEGAKYHQESSVFVHTMMVLEDLKDESSLLKLTALYHDIAKPYCYRTYGNGAGHESIELVEPRIDIQIPKKLLKKMLLLISQHGKISLIKEMKPAKVASFYESFKGDKELFIALLRFKEADNNGRVCDEAKLPLDQEKLLMVFDKITKYSPKEWIKAQKVQPSGEQISEHIHKNNINIIKTVLQSICY
jgi:tRNA nucleotidyltransferase (CCA-adding enzyme)